MCTLYVIGETLSIKSHSYGCMVVMSSKNNMCERDKDLKNSYRLLVLESEQKYFQAIQLSCSRRAAKREARV